MNPVPDAMPEVPQPVQQGATVPMTSPDWPAGIGESFDPYGGQTVAPGKTDMMPGSNYGAPTVAPGKGPNEMMQDAVKGDMLSMPSAPPSTPSSPAGMNYTPELPGPMQQPITNYDYLRTTPAPAGMNYTPGLPGPMTSPYDQQTVAPGKGDSGVNGLADYDNLGGIDQRLQETIMQSLMGGYPTGVPTSLMNTQSPYGNPFYMGSPFSDLSNYGPAKLYADRLQ